MGDEELFHLLGRDVLPSSDDHVLDATDDLAVSVFQEDVLVSANIIILEVMKDVSKLKYKHNGRNPK